MLGITDYFATVADDGKPGEHACIYVYIYLGSSRHVKCLPFGSFCWVKRHKFYTLGRSRYIYNISYIPGIRKPTSFRSMDVW